MFNDEEEEDDGAGGVTRYPVMPSLVALQQMKNRLHLAFLGKKLMKWTAMATSKELRKLAAEMNLAFDTYGEEFSRAFMLLARCRYYYPHMNAVVIHNVKKEAASVVETDYRSVAGVKIVTLDLIEKGFDPNEHLGIERGGTTIQETKKCWRELLKLVVLMLQQRVAFRMMYDANKSATKKQNVLAKLVIPKIQKAIAYINSELEEREREETFRLKRFKQTKDKKTQKKKDAAKVIDLEEEPYVEAEPDIIIEKLPPPSKSCACALAHPNQFVDKAGNFDCPICKLADKNVAIKIAPCTLCLPEVKEAQQRVKHLMAHVNQVLLLSKQYLLAETSPCCKEEGKDNEGGELNYVGLKQQLEFMSVTCTCPHKELDTKSDDSCTCKPPCKCDEQPKFKDCCGGPEKDVGRSGSEYQTYNLCSIYGSSSCPQSMTTGSNFRNSSKNYPAVPPFFYLYSGPYVRSETGFHSLQSRSAKPSKKGLDSAPYKNELTQVKPPCPCAPEEKKTCSCEALSPRQPSENPCVCDSTEILPQNHPSGQCEAVGRKETCPSCQVVSSLHSPKPTTDLAKRITRLSEPCLKIKLSVSGYLPDTKSVDPETAKNSESNLKSTRFNPIRRANANLEVNTSSTKLLEDDTTQTKTCPCKAMVENISSEIISGQSSEDLCSCGSTETLVPIVLQSSHYDPLLPQSDVVEMICKGIFQTDQPATSLPPPNLSTELAERVAKASQPYFKKKCSRNEAHPVDEIEEVPKYPACYLKSIMSKKSTCSCKSLNQTKSCSCKSMQSCPCGMSDESSRGSNSSTDLSNTTSGPPYFKRPATFFTAVPQNFTPLISYTKEKNIGQYDLHNMTNTALLRGTSISSNFADQYLYFNPYTRDQNYKNGIFSEANSIAGSLNKIFSKQAAYLSPYTREGKPGPCGISEVSYVTCPISNTVSKQSSVYAPYTLKENSTSYANDSKYSTYFPSYSQVGKRVLCSNSQVSSIGGTLDDIDSLSTYIASYTAEEKSEYCGFSETGSITNELNVDSKQCTTSSTHTLAENIVNTDIDITSKSPDATVYKDFSIYVSMNPQNNTPYVLYTQQGNNACSNYETDQPGTPKFKDCCTYVTVIRKRPVPYTREGRPGPCGVCEMVYKTYFVISEDCATYVTTVPKKNQEGNRCGSLSTITTSSSPFSISYGACSNCDTVLQQKENSNHCSICRIVKLSRQFGDFAPRTQNSEHSDNTTLNNNNDMSDSEIYKICNACNPIPKVPYTREGIPGPCGVDEENSAGNQVNVDSEQFRNIIPYTREEIAKLCGVSDTNTIVRSLTSKQCTGGGMSGSYCVSDTSHIAKCPCNSATKPIPNVDTCIREGKPGPCKVPDTNNIAGSRCNAAPKCLVDVKPCTQAATPRPCGFININNIEGADSVKISETLSNVEARTGKRKPGPCCGSCCIPDTDRHTGATCVSIPKKRPDVGAFLQESTPRSCCLSKTNNNAGGTCMNTPKMPIDVGVCPQEKKPRPCVISETSKNAGATCMKLPDVEAYTPNKTRPCGVSETHPNDGVTCMKTPKTLPNVGTYAREGTPRPCGVSETNNNAGATCMNIPKTLPNIEAVPQDKAPRPCCLPESKQNAGVVCMKNHKTLPDDGAYARDRTTRPCGGSERNPSGGATCKKTLEMLPDIRAFSQEGTPLPCGVPEINNNAGVTCMKTPKMLPDGGAYARDETPRPCGGSERNPSGGATCKKTLEMLPDVGAFPEKFIPWPCCLSEPNQNVGAVCKKTQKTIPDIEAYTPERTRPCGGPETNRNDGATCMKTPNKLPDIRAFPQEGTPQPCGVTETNNTAGVTCKKTHKTFPDVGAFSQEGTPRPCGVSKTNRNDGATCMKTPNTLPDVGAFPQEGTPRPCSVTETNNTAVVTCRKTHKTFPDVGAIPQERIPRRCCLSETNRNEGATCMKTPNTLPDDGAFPQERIPWRCCLPETNRNDGVTCKKTPRTLPDGACTREGTPRPCGVSEVNNNAGAVCMKTPRIFPCDEAYKREETPRPGDLPFEMKSHRTFPCDEAYTREGTPGPCGVSESNSNAGPVSLRIPKNIPCDGAYTREGTPDTDRIEVPNSNKVPDTLPGAGVKTQEGKLELKVPETNKTADTLDPQPPSNDEPNTHEGTREPSSAANKDQVIGYLYNTTLQPSSDFRVYTQEEISGRYGVSKSNRNPGSVRYTVRKLLSHLRPYARETTVVPCGISETSHITGNSIGVPETPPGVEENAQEGISGPCETGTNEISGSVPSEDPQSLSNVELHTREESRGPYAFSNKDKIVGYFYNTALKPSLDFRAYAREDIPDRCGVSKKNCNAGSSYTARELLSDLGPYTVEEIPRQCGSSETITESRYNTVNNPIPNVNLFIQDEKSGPCCVSDTNYIAGSRWMTAPKRSSNVEHYTRQVISVSSDISEINNITDSFFNTTPKPSEENRPYIREATSGSQGLETDHIAGADSITVSETPSGVEVSTREETSGSRDVDKTNSMAGSIRNMIPKFFSRPYTREGVPGPCGVSEKGFNGRSQAKFCHLEPYTIQEHRGPYCEAQSCMMCLTSPCTLEAFTRHTVNHNTKDAVTYVTVVPRLMSCTREAVPGSCSTCKKRNTHTQAESNKSSAFCCKARAPHIRINETRSLRSIFPASCSSCKRPATSSEATSMLLPTYIVAIPSSTKTSGTCCCKSSRLSTASCGCGPSYNQSERGCSVCGRSTSKLNSHMMSVSYLTSISHGNCDTTGSTSLKSQPCSGCGKATLVMSCASNPSVKSVAIGTCETYCASSKRTPIPKVPIKSSHCHFGKTSAMQQCSACSINKDVESSSSEESTTSSESENCASEDCKISEKKKKDTSELGFGCYEIGFKKITKICKYKNPDGTITDEKRIITIETTKKRPQKPENLNLGEETSVSCSLEDEANSNSNNCECKSVRNVKSDTVQDKVEIDVCPKIRRCISAQICNNVKGPIVPKSCLTNSLLKCPLRPHDTDNDSKCKCDKKSSENARRSFDKSTSASCVSKQQDACTSVCAKSHHAKDSKSKYQGVASCLVPTRKVCPKRYPCLDDTPKSDCKSVQKSTTSTCTDGPQDTKREVKCCCTNNSPSEATEPEPTEQADSDGGPKCDFTSSQVQESHDREQQTQNSDSAPKSTPNKPQDSENDQNGKCDCAKKSESKPTPPVCCNRPEDSDNRPKCDCTKARKSVSKAAAPICCGNSVQATDSKPDDNVVFLVPSGQICNNSFHVLENIPMSNCTRKSLQKLIAPICINGLHDTKSGPKCSCAKKAPSKPVCPNRLKDSDNIPKHDCHNSLSKPVPVCANKEHNLKNDLKCKCGKSTKTPQEPDSDQKFEYLSIMVHKSTSPLWVCSNPQQDSENEPKSEDGNAVFIVPNKSPAPCTPEPQDIKNEKKCSCRKSQSKPPVPVCANKQHDSGSDPKCKCGNKSIPKSSTPVCPNKIADLESRPKCGCATKTPPKPTPPICANRLEDSDSGPKCDCPNEPPKPTAPVCDDKLKDSNGGPKCDCVTKTPPICANRLEDSDSGPKCDCPNETPKPTTPECANRLEESDSGPKCYCASNSNPVSNDQKSSGCDPMCEFASKILPMLMSPDHPDSHPVTNRKAKGNEDNFIFLALTGKGRTSSLKPTNPECANRLEDSDSGSECNCDNQSSPKTNNRVCANMLEDSNSDIKNDCVSKSFPEFKTTNCTHCYQVSDSQSKDYKGKAVYVMSTGMTCGLDNNPKSKSLPKLKAPICATWLHDKDKTEYNCVNKSPCKTTPVCTNRIQDSDDDSKCDCIDKSPKSTVPICGNRLEDSDSGEKCDCVNKTLPEPIAPKCANRLQDSDSGSNCDCTDIIPSVKTTESDTALDMRNAIENYDDANKLPSDKLQNEKEAGKALDSGDVKGDKNRGQMDDVKVDGNREERTQDKAVSGSPQEEAEKVLNTHDVKDKDNCEEKLPLVKTQDKEVSCSPQEGRGRVLDLHNLKENQIKLQNQEREEGGKKLRSIKTQDRVVSCSSLQRETGIVIDLKDIKEIEKEEICTCKNICKCDESHSNKPEEPGRVVDLNNCKCQTKMLSTKAHIKEIYDILHSIVGKVIDTSDIDDNRNCGGKIYTTERINEEVCCALHGEKGRIVDLCDKKDKCNLDKPIISITCHGGSGMVLNLNNAKDNFENRLKEYMVPSKRTICKPIQKTDIAMSTTDLFSKSKTTCVTTSTKKVDSNSCCPVKIIPKPRKICCCTTAHDASKLSIFKGVNMMDALRQLFQHSNPRSQKVQDKNICKTCYSPLSNPGEIEPGLCDNCKEKLIDENEQHYRCTNYSTEPGTPSCKSAPSPLCHRFCFSKNNFRVNAEDRESYHTQFDIKTPPIVSDTCLNCPGHGSCGNDVATSTKSRDVSYVRIVKKGKIEHGCTKCGTRDGESHSHHKS